MPPKRESFFKYVRFIALGLVIENTRFPSKLIKVCWSCEKQVWSLTYCSVAWHSIMYLQVCNNRISYKFQHILCCNLTCSRVRYIDTSPFQQGSPVPEEYHPYKPHVDIYAGRLILDTHIDPTGKF